MLLVAAATQTRHFNHKTPLSVEKTHCYARVLFSPLRTLRYDALYISGQVAEGDRLIGPRAVLQIPQAKNRYGKIDGRGDEKLCAFFYVSAR